MKLRILAVSLLAMMLISGIAMATAAPTPTATPTAKPTPTPGYCPSNALPGPGSYGAGCGDYPLGTTYCYYASGTPGTVYQTDCEIVNLGNFPQYDPSCRLWAIAQSCGSPVTVKCSGPGGNGGIYTICMPIGATPTPNPSPTATPRPTATPQPTHKVCTLNTCTTATGTGPDECDTIGRWCAYPTHLGCSQGQCITVDGVGPNLCKTNQDCPTHSLCEPDGSCSMYIDGPGPQQCRSVSDCPQPPKHKQCSGSTCVTVNGAGTDTCATDVNCAPKHTVCSNGMCTYAIGAGTNQCVTNSQCTHFACSGSSCILVNGAGTNTCTSSMQCLTHKTCSGGTCITVGGAGTSTCSTNAQCTSPTPRPRPIIGWAIDSTGSLLQNVWNGISHIFG